LVSNKDSKYISSWNIKSDFYIKICNLNLSKNKIESNNNLILEFKKFQIIFSLVIGNQIIESYTFKSVDNKDISIFNIEESIRLKNL
jgi:hypothetical protein